MADNTIGNKVNLNQNILAKGVGQVAAPKLPSNLQAAVGAPTIKTPTVGADSTIALSADAKKALASEREGLSQIKSQLINAKVIDENDNFNFASIANFKNSDLYKGLDFGLKSTVDQIASDYGPSTAAVTDNAAATLGGGLEMPAMPQGASAPAAYQPKSSAEDIQAAQDVAAKVGKDGTITHDGTNEENAATAKTDVENMKKTRTATEDKINSDIDVLGKDYAAKYETAKTAKINKDYGDPVTDKEILKKLTASDAQGSIQKKQVEERDGVYKTYGDPAKDDTPVDGYNYEKDSLNNEATFEAKYGDVKSKIGAALKSNKVNELNSAAQYSASAGADIDALAAGLNKQKAKLQSAINGADEKIVTSALQSTLNDVQQKLEKALAYKSELGQNATKLKEQAKVMANKRDADVATIATADKNTAVKTLVDEKAKKIADIGAEKTKIAAAVKDKKFDDIQVDKDLDDTAKKDLQAIVDKMKTTNEEGNSTLASIDKSIKTMTEQQKGIEAKAKANPKGKSKEVVQTGLGDTIGKITEALSGIAGLVQAFKGMQSIGNSMTPMGVPGLPGLPQTGGTIPSMPKADMSGAAAQIAALNETAKNSAAPYLGGLNFPQGQPATNLSLAQKTFFGK